MVVIRSPAAKSDHTWGSLAVAGGVHGRSADSAAASTVSWAPLTVIFAPSMASTTPTRSACAAGPDRPRSRRPGPTPDDVGHDQGAGWWARCRSHSTAGRRCRPRSRSRWRWWRRWPWRWPSPRRERGRQGSRGRGGATGERGDDGGDEARRAPPSPPPTTACLAPAVNGQQPHSESTLQRPAPRQAEGPTLGALLAVIASAVVPGDLRMAQMGRLYRVIAGTVVATTTLSV